MLQAMTTPGLPELEEEVRRDPRGLGPRLRLGQALIEAGRAEDGAAQLRLAAQIDPCNPHVAVLAATALAACGMDRDAALLLSTRVAAASNETVLAASELLAIEGLLGHPKAFVRCHVARGIGRLRIAQAGEALARACTDRNGAVRLAAAASLRALGAH